MTQPSAEKVALLNLARQSFETFAPRFREVALENGRRVSRSGFLFSRYVFVWITEHCRWRSINGTRGIQKLFMIDERPAFLHFEDEARIMELKARCDAEGWIDLNKVPTRKIGDEVTVTGGPFYGFKGIWQGQSGAEREFVLLNMLGRAVKVEVDHAQLA